jgi:hypothetical protein
MKNWSTLHPDAWITDPAGPGKLRYEAHQYWNSNSSGVYGTYDAELAATEAQGW